MQADLVSDCWDVVNSDYGPGWEDHHPLTNKYPGGLSKRSVDTENGAFGVDLAYSDNRNTPFLGLGKYRIEIYEDGTPTGAIFYIDYRTSHIGEQVGGPDITFYYDAENKKVYCDQYYNELATNETIWDMRDNVYEITTNLEPHPPANFQITNQNQWNSNPQLTWDHSIAEKYRTGYEVYCKQPTGSYQRIAQLSKNTTSYTDQNTIISEAGYNISYYVKTVNGVWTSEPSPSISVVGHSSNKTGILNNIYTFQLKQNYPNPFNPTTTISYTIPRKEFVTLKVFDTLGKEVGELVNEIKAAGDYKVYYTPGNLPSGIYFYTIKAGTLTKTSKLLFMK